MAAKHGERASLVVGKHSKESIAARVPKHSRNSEAIVVSSRLSAAKPKGATAVAVTGMFAFAKALFVVVATVALAILVSISFASAGNYAASESDEGASPADMASEANDSAISPDRAMSIAGESFILGTSATRNMDVAISQTEEKEEAARIAAEEAARAEEAEKIAQAQQAQSSAPSVAGSSSIDFSVGKDAFISEWTERIDNYLYGSPLSGYGADFATAAWDFGVDPRWSPAISNTESTKGENCFATHNAWGWMSGSFPNWSTAIRAHVKGLSEGYGFTISLANAKRYCPPNAEGWYATTLSEMSKI